MLPIKFFGSIQLRVSEEMLFEEFQDGRHGHHRISELTNFSNSESLCRSDASHQVLAQSDPRWEEMLFEEFQDGPNSSQLGYPNRTILAILNLYNAPMLPIKFQLNLTYGSGDVVWKISRWPPWQPSWILEQNDFSNFEFLCDSDASHQVSAQSDLWFGRRRRFKKFKMAAMAAILDLERNNFSKFWIFVSLWCLLSSLAQSE